MAGRRAGSRGDLPYYRPIWRRATAVLLTACVIPAAAIASLLFATSDVSLIRQGGSALLALGIGWGVLATLVTVGRLVRSLEEARRENRRLVAEIRQADIDTSTRALSLAFVGDLRSFFASAATSLDIATGSTDDRSDPDLVAALHQLRAATSRGGEAVSRFESVVLQSSVDHVVTDVDVPALLRDLVSLLDHETYHRRITVEWDLESALPPARASYARVRHVFLGVLLDALRIAGEDATIAIRATRRGDCAMTTITVAEPGTTRSEAPGPGLSTCRSILEEMGGSLTVDAGSGPGVRHEILIPFGATSSDRS